MTIPDGAQYLNIIFNKQSWCPEEDICVVTVTVYTVYGNLLFPVFHDMSPLITRIHTNNQISQTLKILNRV